MQRAFVITIFLVCLIFPDAIFADGKKAKSKVIDSFEIVESENFREYPQDHVLSGIVVDSEGNPLPGVNVTIAGTKTQVVTDAEGKFELAVNTGSTLNISFIGYSTSSFTVQEMKNIKIDIESGIVEFCCTNHDPSHCARTMDEMRKLTREHKCTFK